MIGSGTPVALARFRVIGAMTSRFFNGREPRWVGSKSGESGGASTVVAFVFVLAFMLVLKVLLVLVLMLVAVLMVVLLRPSLRRGREPR